MNRNTAKELLPVMQAFADGKIIEGRIVGITDWTEAEELSADLYEGHKVEYRIKSEAKFDPKALKPFDKVLVRDHNNDLWTSIHFSYIKDDCYPVICGSEAYKCCIPYNDETKHLVGTKEEAPEHYKYWED